MTFYDISLNPFNYLLHWRINPILKVKILSDLLKEKADRTFNKILIFGGGGVIMGS